MLPRLLRLFYHVFYFKHFGTTQYKFVSLVLLKTSTIQEKYYINIFDRYNIHFLKLSQIFTELFLIKCLIIHWLVIVFEKYSCVAVQKLLRKNRHLSPFCILWKIMKRKLISFCSYCPSKNWTNKQTSSNQTRSLFTNAFS